MWDFTFIQRQGWKEKDRSIGVGLPRTLEDLSGFQNTDEETSASLLLLSYTLSFKFRGEHPGSWNRKFFGTGQSYCSAGGKQVKRARGVGATSWPEQEAQWKKGWNLSFPYRSKTMKPVKWECCPPQTRVYISVEKSWKYFSALDVK